MLTICLFRAKKEKLGKWTFKNVELVFIGLHIILTLFINVSEIRNKHYKSEWKERRQEGVISLWNTIRFLIIFIIYLCLNLFRKDGGFKNI